ncbi:hypothetical protein K490DRAFT_75716 [Saccharata proteae CBS 121410]|uniref:DUF1680-domain-containing protein n=1 Tax=Saccharata proteae CBS 121410 TaxID=1314787 RepID=A0A9P4HQ31_9PEZI|nr:hypothetical protein K490DRAFT_75716 [Saccharata proteae CBS 121410]
MHLRKIATAAGVPLVVSAQANKTLVPLVFQPLPLGTIKPAGWLADQMTLMASGLAGREKDFYHYVAQSSWLGGSQEYSDLNEGFPYWFNGLVPLAYGLDDSRLKGQVADAVSYVLGHQAADGWIGPETGTARNFWARYPVMLGLMQLVEADGETYGEEVLEAMYRFVALMNGMLKDNYTGYLYHDGDAVPEGDTTWGRVRVQDMLISLQWMYEKHPGNSSGVLLENMQYLIDGAIDWADWWQQGVFITEDLNDLSTEPSDGPRYPYEHGVNAGQGLKALAVFRRYTQNDSLLDTTRNGVSWTFQYHSAASGAILADERLAGLAPYYGSETCTLVETMYSLSYLYQAMGDNSFADQCELVAFNALPVQLTPDWWARQYVSEPNQPYSEELSDKPFFNVNNWGQTYGMEVDYPCCTVNHPQGFPKFASAMFVLAGEDGLAHALLGPGTVSTSLSSGDVTVECSTQYPFANTLSYTITAASPFTFYVRVPNWADSSASSVSVGGSAMALDPDSHTGLHSIPVGAGTTEITYTLSTSLTTKSRANDTISVHYGSLVYALYIPGTNTSTAPKSYSNSSYFYTDYPAQARDYQITNTSAWNIAIDPSSLQFHTSNDSSSGLANPIFAPGAPPTWVTAMGCEIEWGFYKGVPDVPPPLSERKCVGEVEEYRLEPLGSAKLHMMDLPTIELS